MSRQSALIRTLAVVAVAVCCSGPATVFVAAAGQASEGLPSLEQVLSTWRQGDLSSAKSMLSQLIADGSSDARLWYYRGIISEQMGEDGSGDWRTAAAREVANSTTRIVNSALERVQGPMRNRIEAIREEARFAIKPDPAAARNQALFRDAMMARAEENFDLALSRLDQAIAGGARDPRVFYIRGVVLAESGDIQNAREMFRQALSLETSAADVRAVNQSLLDVQGEVRRMIEEEVTIQRDGQQVTRQKNQQQMFREEEQMYARRQSAIDQQANRLLAEAERDNRERQIRAAEEILRAEENRDQNQFAPPVTSTAPAEPLVAEAAPAEAAPAGAESPKPATNPFGFPQPTAEAPETGVAPAANPFITGNPSSTGAVSSGTGTRLDFSWLAPNTELVLYVRPADLTNSRFMSPLMQLPPVQQGLQTMADQAGFSISDMESVTYGMGDVMAAITGAAMAGAGGGQPDPNKMAQQFMNNRSALSVVRASRDIDFAAIAQTQNAAQVTHGDKVYYLLGEQNPQVPQTAVYAVDARTYLFATEPAMKAALDRGPGNAGNPQFGFVSADSHMVLAFSSPALAPISGSIPAPQNAPPFVVELVNAVRGKVNGIALSMQASADLNTRIQLSLTDPAAGNAGLKALQGGVDMLQQLYPAMKAQVPPKLQPVADSAVQSASAQFSEPLLSFSIMIPGSLVTTLQESPELLGPLMMPGGMGPPNGGFGPPPGDAPPVNPSQGFGFPPTTPPQN